MQLTFYKRGDDLSRSKIPNSPSIRRMPSYLHKLMLMHQNGEKHASTTRLAEYINLDTIIVRKDFELTGISGQPGVGYKTDELIDGIRRYLNWDRTCRACLVGAGSLGSALIGHEEFAEYGLEISSVFDSNPDRIDSIIHGRRVTDVRKMTETLKDNPPDLAIICVPSNCAQMVTDELISCGVKAFWNFANVCLRVPADVIVQREVIAGGLAVLFAKINKAESGEIISNEE